MTEQRGPTPNEERSDPTTGEPTFNKERESKEDGRYIIFYTFEDEQEGGDS